MCVATDQSVYTINLSEKQIEIKGKTPHTWMLKLGVATGKTLPLKVKGDDSLTGELKGIPYGIVCLKGNMKQSGNTVFLNPENNRLVVDCSFRNFK